MVAVLCQVWDVAEGNPVCVHTHDSIDAGAIFCAAFAPDEPFYIAAGGAKGKVNHHHHVPTCTVGQLNDHQFFTRINSMD